jgi:indolepyruvate ferredoxin oxidoreductase beta subunit
MSAAGFQGLVAGVGGQGVIFVTRLLSAGLKPKYPKILVSEVHGMAQRGGSVVSHLKAGDFAGPLVRLGAADLLLSLEPGEAIRNLPYLRPQGALVVSAPDVSFLSARGQKELAAHTERTLFVDAAAAALQAGAPKGANVVLLAAAAAAGMLPIDFKELSQTLDALSPAARRQANRKLLALGKTLGAAATGG